MAAEEADVDIEGDLVPAAAQSGSDENTASVLQDHYLDSSWRTENGLIPWTLDSTISEENRAVIEKMLLEEDHWLLALFLSSVCDICNLNFGELIYFFTCKIKGLNKKFSDFLIYKDC
uniref:Myb like, SWIRM and MPN domains 1 n=1 Tax=Ovis aries TaxID=9940 RepID=A0AC11EAN3_SHEEP